MSLRNSLDTLYNYDFVLQ